MAISARTIPVCIKTCNPSLGITKLSINQFIRGTSSLKAKSAKVDEAKSLALIKMVWNKPRISQSIITVPMELAPSTTSPEAEVTASATPDALVAASAVPEAAVALSAAASPVAQLPPSVPSEGLPRILSYQAFAPPKKPSSMGVVNHSSITLWIPS